MIASEELAKIIAEENDIEPEVLISVMSNKTNKELKKLYLFADNFSPHDTMSYCINDYTKHLELVPNVDEGGSDGKRTTIYIAGRSGSGKTHYAMRYAKQYRKYYPDRDIFLISAVADHPLVKSLNISVIDTTSEDAQWFFVDDETKLTAKCFNDCLVMFDDVESHTTVKIRKAVAALRDEILCLGRHQNISCIVCAHIIRDGEKTRTSLRESDFWVIFPTGNNSISDVVYQAVSSYCGRNSSDVLRSMIDNKQIGRSATICVKRPGFIMGDRCVRLV